VLDHFGLPDLGTGPGAGGLRTLLRWAERGATLKLSGAFRVSALPYPYPDLAALAPGLLAAFGPKQRVWGSDWPFVGLDRRPDLNAELRFARTLVPDPEEQELLFAANPARLFGFAQA
jgi:predicted TIM-barrel fold metal-dependent hydrolase